MVAPYKVLEGERFELWCEAIGDRFVFTGREKSEAARKVLLAYGGAEARRIHDAAFPHAPLEPGRNIRITMEEEVKECCEKWRRLTAGNDDRRDGSRWLRVKYDQSCVAGLYGPVVFCPECRKPL
jgi:hypothetical protein